MENKFEVGHEVSRSQLAVGGILGLRYTITSLYLHLASSPRQQRSGGYGVEVVSKSSSQELNSYTSEVAVAASDCPPLGVGKGYGGLRQEELIPS